MKTLLAVCFALSMASTHAMEFSLPCSADEGAPAEVAKIPKMNLVKKVVKENGKWNNHYLIRFENKTEIQLKSAGTGDEDYTDYRVVGSNKHNISGASIQHKLKWAAVLIDGSSWISCE